jgi:phosphate transport system permease protein
MDAAIEQRPRRNNAFSAVRRALSPTGNTGDAIFRLLLSSAALLVLLIVVAMILALAYKSRHSISQFGFRFLSGTNWDPVRSEFGALAFVYGTVVSSLIALLIAVPLSLGIAIFLVEQAPRQLARPLAFVVELIGGHPFGCLRTLGNFCTGSFSPCSRGAAVTTLVRLVAVV